MKTPHLIGLVERTAAAPVNIVLKAVKDSYDSLMKSADTATVAQQKRYVRAAEKGVSSAERTIAQIKRRIAQAKRKLAQGRKRVKRSAPARRNKAARKTAGRKKRL